MTRVLGVLALAMAVGSVGCSSSQIAGTDDSYGSHGSTASMGNMANSPNTGNTASNDMSGENLSRPADKGAKGLAPAREQQFVADASAGGVYEITAANLAATHASSDRVKAAAQHILNDHTKADNQLAELAKQKGIKVPGVLTPDQEQMISKLKGLQGADFDKEFLSQQAQAHKNAIAKFQAEADNGVDQDMRSFASRTLPTLQEHLRMIQSADTGVASEK